MHDLRTFYCHERKKRSLQCRFYLPVGSAFFSLVINYCIFHFTLLTFSLTRLGQIFFCKKYRRKYTCHRPNSVCYLKGDKNFLNFSETSSRPQKLCYNEKGSCRIRLSVGHQLPKLNRRVRLPYPACRNPRNIQHAWNIPGFLLSRYFYYHIIIYLCSIVASASHMVAYPCGFRSFPLKLPASTHRNWDWSLFYNFARRISRFTVRYQ